MGLYRSISSCLVSTGGIHVYDGHIHDTDLAAELRRSKSVRTRSGPFATSLSRRACRCRRRLSVARRPSLFMRSAPMGMQSGDGGVLGLGLRHEAARSRFPAGHPFAHARDQQAWSEPALSGPRPQAVASESPHPRVQLLGLPNTRAVGHSEEHLVLETIGPRSSRSAPVSTGCRGMSAQPSRFTTKRSS